MEEELDIKLVRYFEIGRKALEKAKSAPVNDQEKAKITIDMASRYISDAEHFLKQEKKLLAFAALNYAHGWLDCGAMMKYFEVKDNKLFTVD